MTKQAELTTTTESEGVTALDDLQQQLDALKALVDGLETRFEQSVSALETRLHTRFDTLKSDIRQDLHSRLEQERSQREAALRELEHKTDTRLHDISGKITTVNETVLRMDGTLSNWHETVKNTNDRYEDARRDIDAQSGRLDTLKGDVDTLIAARTVLQAQQNALHLTIHGDSNHDGPDSLFKLMNDLRVQVDTRFREQSTQLSAMLALAQANARAIDAMQHERQQDKERWQRRWQMLKMFGAELLKNRWFWGLGFLMIVGLTSAIRPDLATTFIDFAKYLFNVQDTP